MATKAPMKPAKKVEVISMPVRDMDEEKKWRAEADLRTLKEAREINPIVHAWLRPSVVLTSK